MKAGERPYIVMAGIVMALYIDGLYSYGLCQGLGENTVEPNGALGLSAFMGVKLSTSAAPKALCSYGSM